MATAPGCSTSCLVAAVPPSPDGSPGSPTVGVRTSPWPRLTPSVGTRRRYAPSCRTRPGCLTRSTSPGWRSRQSTTSGGGCSRRPMGTVAAGAIRSTASAGCCAAPPNSCPSTGGRGCSPDLTTGTPTTSRLAGPGSPRRTCDASTGRLTATALGGRWSAGTGTAPPPASPSWCASPPRSATGKTSSWPTSPPPAPATARPRRSTCSSSASSAWALDSGISVTTGCDYCCTAASTGRLSPPPGSEGGYHAWLRRACNRYLANAVQCWAFCSLHNSGWAREFYDTQRQRGKTHHAALRALGNRWLEVLWHCLTKGVLYNENTHVANR